MKRKMAFVDLTNFKDWPMGGMLEYELAVLPYLAEYYELDIWGYSVNGIAPAPLILNGKKYPIHLCGNCSTHRRIIPNFWKGLSLLAYKNDFEDKYDIVYAHTGSCLTALAKIINKEKTKLVYHQHGLNHQVDFQLRSLIQRPFLKWAQEASDVTFVVSDIQSVEAYSKKMASRTHTNYISIGSPICLDKFDANQIRKKKEGAEIRNFLYTGRLSAFKNVKMLVDAFAMYVNQINGNAIFSIAGIGEELNIIKNKVKELGIDKNVRLLGSVPHDAIYRLLSESDVFITASRGEGVSVSVLEAYAAGIPVICAKVPGLEKQIIDGRTGLFVEEYTAKGFYDKMLALESTYYEMISACLEESRKYDAKIIADKIISNIENLYT